MSATAFIDKFLRLHFVRLRYPVQMVRDIEINIKLETRLSPAITDRISEYSFDVKEINEAGYVVCYSDGNMHSILEHCSSSTLLSHQLSLNLSERYGVLGNQVRYIDYWSPLELGVAVEGSAHGAYFLWPQDKWVERELIVAPQYFDYFGETPHSEETEAIFDALFYEGLSEGVVTDEYMRPEDAPPKYNQHRFDQNRRISGCTPVAGALMAASAKKVGRFDNHKIFKNIECWDVDWFSKSRCDGIKDFIEDLHRRAKTTANGATYAKDLAPALVAVLKHHYGVKSPIFYRAGKKISRVVCAAGASDRFRNYPVLSGMAVWSDMNIEEYFSLKKEEIFTPRPGDVGHSCLNYGWRRSDRMSFVSLGWGLLFPDKWIAFDGLRQHSVVFENHR